MLRKWFCANANCHTPVRIRDDITGGPAILYRHISQTKSRRQLRSVVN
jgi:hypothetical protein